MKNAINGCLAAATLLVASGLQARQIVCPGDFHFVNTGDDIQTVIDTCGQPLRIVHKTSKQQKKPVYWTYYGLGGAGNSSQVQSPRITAAQGREFVNSTSVLKFIGQKLVNISGASTGSMRCAGGDVAVGDSMNAVKSQCGRPASISDGNAPSDGSWSVSQRQDSRPQRDFRYNAANLTPKIKTPGGQGQSAEEESMERSPHKFTVLIYQPKSYMPKTAFMFIDNKLTQAGSVSSEHDE